MNVDRTHGSHATLVELLSSCFLFLEPVAFLAPLAKFGEGIELGLHDRA